MGGSGSDVEMLSQVLIGEAWNLKHLSLFFLNGCQYTEERTTMYLLSLAVLQTPNVSCCHINLHQKPVKSLLGMGISRIRVHPSSGWGRGLGSRLVCV